MERVDCRSIVGVGRGVASLMMGGGVTLSRSSLLDSRRDSTTASELSSELGVKGKTPELMNFEDTREPSDKRSDFGGGDGLSCARIMRLAIAEDGSGRNVKTSRTRKTEARTIFSEKF